MRLGVITTCLLGCLTFVPALAARGAVVTFTAARDTTIYSENQNSNGAGGGVFAGRTSGGNVRRALVFFNVTNAVIPAGSVITGVSVNVTQTKIGPGASSTFELHRLLADWGEGTSSGTGQGGAATTNDATWGFRKFNTSSWSTAGGDFAGVSASTSIGTTNTTYTFSSQPGLVNDVQQWLNSPATNFGWILRAADESGSTNSREFGSREGGAPASITVTYTSVPEPSGALVPALLSAAGTLRRRRRWYSPSLKEQ